MSTSRYGMLLAVITVTALAAGWYGYQRYGTARSPNFSFIESGVKTLPDFSFPDLQGVDRTSSEWQGRVLVINFWATWCPPCREEMPLFINTQKRLGDRGLQVVGIAIDERELVKDFSDVYGINFPVVIGGPDAIKLATSLGNKFGALPFTAIFDRSGETRFVHAGEISAAVLERQVRDLL